MRYIEICASALLFAPAICSAQPATAQKPVIKVGQVAIYVVEEKADKREGEDTQTIVAVEGDVVKVKSVNPARNPVDRELIFTSEWNTVVSTISGSRSTPHTGSFQFPLSVGKTWQAQMETETLTGARLRTSLATKVLGIEKVQVPAGEYETFKIEQTGWANGVTFSGSLRVQQLTWYAPSIGRVVRSEYKDWAGSALPRAHNIIQLKSLQEPS